MIIMLWWWLSLLSLYLYPSQAPIQHLPFRKHKDAWETHGNNAPPSASWGVVGLPTGEAKQLIW